MPVFETKYDRDIHVLQARLVKCRKERDALLKRLEAAEGLAEALEAQYALPRYPADVERHRAQSRVDEAFAVWRAADGG